MPVLGLTGGIATGKSTFARRFPGELSREIEVFDSDRCVHDLLAADSVIRESIVAGFGPGCLGPDGWPDRRKLREIVFASDERRQYLEGILHPAVRARWTEKAFGARGNGGWLLVDIPLLYETGAQDQFDRVIVVACPRATQQRRLIRERGLAPDMAEKFLAAQMDIGAKTRLADHVIWNDSTVANLDGQAGLLASWLCRRFG